MDCNMAGEPDLAEAERFRKHVAMSLQKHGQVPCNDKIPVPAGGQHPGACRLSQYQDR
jgi:hypothetical protein